LWSTSGKVWSFADFFEILGALFFSSFDWDRDLSLAGLVLREDANSFGSPRISVILALLLAGDFD